MLPATDAPSERAGILTEVVLPGVVEPDGLLVRTRPIPPPAKGQALVQMLATGVSLAENAMRRNRYPGQPKFPFVLGYDLVGVVTAVGAGVDRALIGTRVAAVTKTGGWSTHLLVDARDLIAVADGLDVADVEAVLLNGITAWQMLHRKAKVKRGDTILVHGGSGGVGTILLQLARHAGIAVIATASPRSHEAIRDLGAKPFDYRDPNLVNHVHALAPTGVNAVFDNIGGPSFKRSFNQLAPGGTLVGYGTASQLEDTNNMVLTFTGILARFATWTLTPNHGRTATFYNFWAGKHTGPARFRQRLATDLNHVMRLLAEKAINPHIAARFPLDQAREALALADSHAASGKIVISP